MFADDHPMTKKMTVAICSCVRMHPWYEYTGICQFLDFGSQIFKISKFWIFFKCSIYIMYTDNEGTRTRTTYDRNKWNIRYLTNSPVSAYFIHGCFHLRDHLVDDGILKDINTSVVTSALCMPLTTPSNLKMSVTNWRNLFIIFLCQVHVGSTSRSSFVLCKEDCGDGFSSCTTGMIDVRSTISCFSDLMVCRDGCYDSRMKKYDHRVRKLRSRIKKLRYKLAKCKRQMGLL